MKSVTRLIALSLMLLPFAAKAQEPAPVRTQVPTTRILAIGRLKAPPTPDVVRLVATKEAPDTLRLYLAGKIDQWYSLKEGNGVVFILNMSSVEEAHALLEALPLGQANLMTFELIPLGPLSPLGFLLPHPDKPAN
jgi:hypothetical protein